MVQNLDRQIGRQMQFGNDWKWLAFPGRKTPIPDRFRDRAQLAVSCMQVLQRKSEADYALWWGPADTGMWGYDFNFLENYNPEFYAQEDFHTHHRLVETMKGVVSGTELKDIWNRWGRNREILFVPEMHIDSVVDQQEYILNIPMDMYIKLGGRKNNLHSPRPGPAISFDEIMSEIFQ